MGAGQIGGIATLLDIDFNNAAGFVGKIAEPTEAQFVVYYLSHALMFCAGALLEAHVVLTPATCVFGERYRFDVFAGTHDFLEYAGSPRSVIHICIHRAFNRTLRGFYHCTLDNLAIMVLDQQYSFNKREELTSFLINRVRYGIASTNILARNDDTTCAYYGWGSRRNGYMVPLLIRLFKVEAKLLPKDSCDEIWNYEQKFLCIYPQLCRSSKYGSLCPDDVGSVLTCSGFLQGMMITRMVDRPCGIGWLDMSHYVKFLSCAVDDAHDLVRQDRDTDLMELSTPNLLTHKTTPY